MKILLYYHAGSRNHGCEAIVRTLREVFSQDEMVLYSFDKESDLKYGLNEILTVKQCEKRKSKYSIFERIMIRLHLYQEGQECFQSMLNEKNIDWAFAIGGDNYCYKGQPEEMAYVNREFKKRNIKTALVGCSIDEEVIKCSSIQKDLKKYNVIVAREHLTFDALKKVGLSNLVIYPDPAFALEIKETDEHILKKDVEYIGINVSPLIMKNESRENIINNSYVHLMHYILNNTNYNILLIPHVSVEWDSDLEALNYLYKELGQNSRVQMLQEEGCEMIKSYISKCSFVVCSRTHVSIAAYSMGIPTLVIGYSIKSKGIATDLFDNYEEYVIAASDIQKEDSITERFVYLLKKKEEIKRQLQDKNRKYKIELEQLRNVFAEKYRR